MRPEEDCRQAALLALDTLVADGVISVLLLDQALRVQSGYGPLAADVAIGAAVDEAVAILTGLASDLLNLQDEPEAVFVLSNVGLATPGGVEKLNIEAFWIASRRQYCLLLHRLGLRTAPEAEIVKQIRARRIAEEHLQQMRQDLASRSSLVAAIAEKAPVALAVVGAGLDYELATNDWRSLFSLGSAPVTGTTLRDHAASAALIASADIDDALAGHATAANTTVLEIGGARREIVWRAVPVPAATGRGHGLVMIAEEVGGKSAEIARLERRIARLEAENRALDDFVTIVAHDLEAPRRAISLAVNAPGAIDRAALDEACLRLQQMLDDLLEHARTGADSGDIEDLDIARIAHGALAATPGGDRFRLVCTPQCRAIRARRVPIEIVLRNLIANAVRHHDIGKGTIEIACAPLGNDMWRLAIVDDGPGIPASERARVLQPFQRLMRGAEGKGLGLAIVAGAVRRLGGQIRLSSRDDATRGTMVTVEWPRDDHQFV